MFFAAETRPAQRVIITATTALVAVTFAMSALDHRFGWSSVPVWLVVVSNVMVAAGLGAAALVIVQNHYAAVTVRVQAGPPLASTGLYGLVVARILDEETPAGALPAGPRDVAIAAH